jgi:hypothetical protein
MLLLITWFLNTSDTANRTKVICTAKIVNAEAIQNFNPYLDMYNIEDGSRIIATSLMNGARVKIAATQDEFNELKSNQWITHISEKNILRKKQRNS